MAELPPPRGRGMALLEALKRRKLEESKPVGAQPEAPPSELPKPKGRAAYLRQLQEAKLKRVGAESSTVKSATVTTESKPESLQVTEKELEDVSNSMSELSFSQKEAVTYRGKYIFSNF